MKAEELRIGNFIYSNGNVLTVQSIDKDGVFGHLLNPKLEPDYLKGLQPIQLTEEWLLKFGFTSCFTKIIGKIEFNVIFSSCCEIEINKQCFVVKYVHELQNLYFALIGEELTIKI